MLFLSGKQKVPEMLRISLDFKLGTPKGLMNRAHAYKAKVEQNKEAGLEVDAGVNGVIYVPDLMAADILLFQATHVPVGRRPKFSILKLRVILRRILIIHLAQHLHYRSM